MSAGQQARRAERTAKQAAESGPIKTLGRVGLVAYGVVHLLVAYLAVRVALGSGARPTRPAPCRRSPSSRRAGSSSGCSRSAWSP